MATSWADRWFGDYPWQDASGTGRTVHAVLEDAEAALRKSAGLLRSSGQEDGARQAERFAAWARFDLEEPLVARQLHLAVARLRPIRQPGLLAGQVLEKVMSLARADRGNVQLVDPQSGALTIIAQHGFDEKFLDHFAVVADRGSACGRAARRNAQLVITDVSRNPCRPTADTSWPEPPSANAHRFRAPGSVSGLARAATKSQTVWLKARIRLVSAVARQASLRSRGRPSRIGT